MICSKCQYDNKELEEEYCISCKEPLSVDLKAKEQKIRDLVYHCMEVQSNMYEPEFKGWFFTGHVIRSFSLTGIMCSLRVMGYEIGEIQLAGRTMTILVLPISYLNTMAEGVRSRQNQHTTGISFREFVLGERLR